jgi:hypothetical protein
MRVVVVMRRGAMPANYLGDGRQILAKAAAESREHGESLHVITCREPSSLGQFYHFSSEHPLPFFCIGHAMSRLVLTTYSTEESAHIAPEVCPGGCSQS